MVRSSSAAAVTTASPRRRRSSVLDPLVHLEGPASPGPLRDAAVADAGELHPDAEGRVGDEPHDGAAAGRRRTTRPTSPAAVTTDMPTFDAVAAPPVDLDGGVEAA